ncbi:hypothetical protein [Kitasatospora sp. NPDC057015]|uniref:hypothetical protein n=1 Tax=Kitasatospora sp. NPDC057015 TaxID=3346001 RepID=UPI003642E126
MPAIRPPSPNATRLRSVADTIDALSTAVPGAYREQGPPSLGELQRQALRIGEQHQLLLGTAAALGGAPLADSAQRALARALADAGSRVGEALATVSRASAMAARIHEVDGLDGPRAEVVRERAGRELNLSLSRTRLALNEAGDGLRREARARQDVTEPPHVRPRAALVRSSGPRSTPVLTGPSATAAPAAALPPTAPRR